mgnify:CR=1 FL=1
MSENIFPKKWASKLPEGFREQAESMSTDDLKKKIIECQQIIASTEKDMGNDPIIEGLKEQLKDKAAVYKDTIVASNAACKFAIYVLDNRGVGLK